MIEINASLDGAKQRDLTLYAGDDETLSLVVYVHDGDTDPIDPASVTNPRIQTRWGLGGTIPVATQFEVTDRCGRIGYRLVAEVNGVTTTLAFGVLTTLGSTWCSWSWGAFA